jgi:NAD(P)-dependent dehydrogenase (short-subunit alcohol dehydrogenase family)
MTRSDNTPVPDYPSRLSLEGLGYVLIGALSQAGAKVLCVDLDAELAEEVASEVGGIPWSGDAIRREESERLFKDASKALGQVDGVVDIVGMARYASLVDLDDQGWAWHFDIVLRHAWLAVQHGARVMIEQGSGGTMVFVASVSGLSSAPLHGAYGAAKAGLVSMVKTAAVELGPKQIRVNAVAPGMVWTPRVSSYLGEEGKQRNAANAPLSRVAYPEDIASAILFLASPLSAYVTGQTLVVDGGVTSKFPYPMDF